MGEWRGITNRRGGATSSTRERRIGLSSRSLLRGRRKAGSQLGRGIQVENGHDGREGGAGGRTFETCGHIVIFGQGRPTHLHRASREERSAAQTGHVWQPASSVRGTITAPFTLNHLLQHAVVDCSSSAIMVAPEVYNVSQSPITSHAFNADRTRSYPLRSIP